MTFKTSATRTSTVSRRLLLSKEFYLHAVEQCRSSDSLSRLLAIHNFHISIEIVLKAILLENGIRTEKVLNIDFEQMLADIDNHPPFKDAQQRLPLRQELRNINQQRNLAQHHVIEPHPSALDDCRVFTHQFLAKSFHDYFGESFDTLSRIDLIHNAQLKALVQRAQDSLRDGDIEDSVCASSAAFQCGEATLRAVLPDEGTNSSFFVSADLRGGEFEWRSLIRAIEKTHARIRESELFAATVGSGVSMSRLNRFHASVPHTDFSPTGHPYFHGGSGAFTQDGAEYALEFVIDCFIKWQSQGLHIGAPNHWLPGLTDYLERRWPKEAS